MNDTLPEMPELPEELCRTITAWSPTYDEGMAHANAIREYARAYAAAEVARVREDAERYRFMAGVMNQPLTRELSEVISAFYAKSKTALDAAIDAARKAGSEGVGDA